MNTLLNLFSIVMFVTCFRVSEQNEHSLKTGFQTFEKDIDVFSTGLAIADFLDNQELDSGLTGEDREKLKDDILQKIAKMLETSETNTILALTLQEEVGRLRDTVSVVRSSLADLDYYLKAENGANELKYKDLFLKRFVEHGVIIEIRKLPDLLTDTAPGLPKPLKSVVLDTTECNMTSVVEFEQVYANLISKAVTLQLVYTKFTELNLDYVKDYWDNLLPGVQNTFDDMENVCIDKFEESVSREIIEDVPVEKLHNNNKERYNWKWNDVFQYQPVASSKWHYFVSPPHEQEKFLFWNGGIGDMNRIIVFGDKNKTKVWDKEAVEIALRENVWVFQKVTKGPNAAKDLYQAIGSFINGINFIYKCIVVFYYDRMPHTKVLIDNPLSPAACVNTYAADNVGTYHACVYPEMWSNFTSYLNEYSDQQMTDPDQQMIDPDQQTIDTEQQMDDPDQQTTDTVQQTIDPDQQIIDPDQPTIDPDQQLVDQQMIDSASMTNPHIMHLLFVTTAVTFIAFC